MPYLPKSKNKAALTIYQSIVCYNFPLSFSTEVEEERREEHTGNEPNSIMCNCMVHIKCENAIECNLRTMRKFTFTRKFTGPSTISVCDCILCKLWLFVCKENHCKNRSELIAIAQAKLISFATIWKQISIWKTNLTGGFNEHNRSWENLHKQNIWIA